MRIEERIKETDWLKEQVARLETLERADLIKENIARLKATIKEQEEIIRGAGDPDNQ